MKSKILLAILFAICMQPAGIAQQDSGLLEVYEKAATQCTKNFDDRQFAECRKCCSAALRTFTTDPGKIGIRQPFLLLMARSYFEEGKYADSEKYYKQILSDPSPLAKERKAIVLSDLGNVNAHLGNKTAAESILKQALSLVPAGSSTYYTITANLASLYLQEEKYQLAYPLAKQALAYARTQSDKQNLATSLGNLGVAESSLDHNKEAAALFEEELNILEEIKPAEDPHYGIVAANLASMYMDMDNSLLAETYANKSIKNLEKALGPTHPDLINPLTTLGAACFVRKKYQESHQAFTRGISVATNRFDAKATPVKVMLVFDVLALLAANDTKQAADVADRALATPIDPRTNSEGLALMQSPSFISMLQIIASMNDPKYKELARELSELKTKSSPLTPQTPIPLRTSQLSPPITAEVKSEESKPVSQESRQTDTSKNATSVPPPSQSDTADQKAALDIYLKSLGQRIRAHWFPAKGDQDKGIILVFNLGSEGQVENLRFGNSEGTSAADAACRDAITESAPFPSPPQIRNAPFEVQMKFDADFYSGESTGLMLRY